MAIQLAFCYHIPKMRTVVKRILPAKGASLLAHYGLTLLIPLLIVILVRLQSVQMLAFAVVVLAKWRMFAVRPRFWLANLRANAVDIIVGLSAVVFIIQADSALGQVVWAALYAGWLLVVKPRSSTLGTSVQAGIAQLAGLGALYQAGAGWAALELVVCASLICYLSARHFFDGFEEQHSRLLSYIWAYFAAALSWLLAHWLLFYGVISQPTVLLTLISFSLAWLYYMAQQSDLTVRLRRQVLCVMGILVLLILLLSDWGDKVVGS